VKKTLTLFTLLISSTLFLSAQRSVRTSSVLSPSDSIPQVFMLGQFDGAPFESLKVEYETQLATVCRNDMEMTYYIWVQMLKRIESHASKTGFDMSGIKLWLYAFWNKDGTLRSLAYYPKPNSRNFKSEEMTQFLSGFVPTYRLPTAFEKNFQHYSFGNFPVMLEKLPDAKIETGRGGRD
jgi:hypothetical protein